MTTTATRIILGGAPEGFDAQLLAKELARGVPVIHVARDDKRLEAMRERTPRGRARWQPSSVKMLLERATRLGLLD